MVIHWQVVYQPEAKDNGYMIPVCSQCNQVTDLLYIPHYARDLDISEEEWQQYAKEWVAYCPDCFERL